MQWNKCLSTVASAAVAVSALLTGLGCESSGSKQSSERYSDVKPFGTNDLGGNWSNKPAPAPAKKAEPKPETKAAPAAAPMSSVSELFYPTGERSTSALWIRHRMPAEVRANAPFESFIDVTNLSSNELKNVSIAGDSFQNLNVASSDPAAANNGGKLTWNLGDFAAKQTKTITVKGAAPAVGVSGLCLTPSYATVLCTTTRVVNPALAITKSITPETIFGCQDITTTIEVTNTGTGAATNVKITDNLPAGLTYNGAAKIEETLGTLTAGQKVVRSYKLKADKPGRYENDASVAADGGLTAQTGKVATVVKNVALALTCKAPQQVFIGRNATFEFTIKNTGDAACAATTITAALPAGTTFVSATEGGVSGANGATWNIGSLAAGASKTVTVTVKPSGRETFNMSATASCSCAQPATTSCSTKVVGIPALLLDGVDNPDPVEVGGNVTYTLKVTNQGSANLTNVVLACDMEAGVMDYVSQTGPTTGTVAGTKITFAPIAVLAPGESKTYTIVVKATKAGQVQFTGRAKSTEITRELVKTETTNFYQ